MAGAFTGINLWLADDFIQADSFIIFFQILE